MYKKIAFALLGFALLTILFAACTIRDTSSLPKNKGVRMGPSDFIDKTVTINKGQSISLVDEASTNHTITNGQWKGSAQDATKEAGAPTINLNFSGAGDSKPVGPFTTAGTFHIYCTIHPGMNLVVTVK